MSIEDGGIRVKPQKTETCPICEGLGRVFYGDPTREDVKARVCHKCKGKCLIPIGNVKNRH